ncbi:oligoribonuclease [Comamonas sp.]|jgi:oligoribonuclease|uniref:oligoribonuclease n=1 Tax=Comamonas sp. TaxID=34028 RepID=UPI0035E257AF
MSEASCTNSVSAVSLPADAPVLPKSDLNMVWLDCEMTGLNPDHDRIIEIAVVVSSADLQTRIEGPVFAIHQSDELLGGMDAWNKGTHGKSGLIDRVKSSTVTEAEAEAALIAFLGKYVPKGKTPLCGNSIGQDRRFMERYMPKLNNFFHYRNIDVSTLKELAKRWKPVAYTSFKKAQRHTALADVHESIDELQHYRKELLSV